MSDIKNIIASVSERLRNVARKSEKSFDSILLLYFQERFLYRLSISDYKHNFLLKGGLYLFSQTGFKARPTKDVDFLAKQISNDLDKLKSSFTSICTINVPSDGVVFQVDEMITKRIKEATNYEGVRVNVTALLGRMRRVLQIDIGFGDVVVPKPQLIDYPSLLEMEIPKLQAYSKESVISEKFEIMISMSVMNSRMKDFLDIYALLSTENYDGRILYEAVYETFQRRGTILEREHPLFNKEFALDENRIRLWNAFLKRTGINQTLDYKEVLNYIVKFLEPIYQSIIMEQEYFGHWNSIEKEWIIMLPKVKTTKSNS